MDKNKKPGIDSEIDDLLSELNETKHLTNVLQKPGMVASTVPVVDETNIDSYVLNSSAKIIQNGMDVIDALKMNVLSSGDAREVESYAKLFASVTAAIDTLNKVNIQNKQSKLKKEVEEMKLKAKAGELTRDMLGIGGIQNQTNNVLIATTREDIMKMIQGKKD